MKITNLSIITLLVALMLSISAKADINTPKREFRGSWIQCVNGQFQGLGRDRMQAELTRHLDALQRCNVNAIFFQVRAEGDALYLSNFEPWSRFLTGQQGLAPNPYWDPLEWMVKECHQRGMEIHAWINPYRAKTATTNELAVTHPYVQHPERFFKYGKLFIFNPALKENRDYICHIITDIITRYDVDGIHMDDYFYPYPEAGTPIPDEAFFQANTGGFTNIADWRRNNVSLLIEQIHNTINAIKPWVKFGVSPFGIYHNARNGNQVPGSNTGGLQNYDDLYADVMQWTSKGWVDYNIPQIYWEIGHKTADYDTLIRWWAQYTSNRPLFIGQDIDRTVKAKDLNNPSINQLPEKMRLQRTLHGVSGSCLWYSAAVANNTGGIADALQQVYHQRPALQPLMPFKDNTAPSKLKKAKVIWSEQGPVLVWIPNSTNHEMQRAVRYAVYCFAPGEKIDITDGSHLIAVTPQTFLNLPYSGGKTKYTYIVTALDRMWNESGIKKVKAKL